MADVLRVWCLVVACTVGVGAGILSAKGFFCRDPDSGKLYPVNTTWPSTTFCGSYTCRLRKRNVTENEHQPFIQVNITKDENSEVIDWPTYANATNTTSVNTDIPETSSENEIKEDIDKSIINEEVRNIVKEKNKDIDFIGVKKEDDRYLTEDEIKILIELLHEVRKSDLEAIVEMYNLAQDVYKEIDTETDENLTQQTIRNMKENRNNRKQNRILGNCNRKTYFYEPLSMSNNHKTVDITEGYESTGIVEKDMTVEGSNISPVTLSPPNYNPNTNNYFQGPLTNEDFGKLPYYYYPTSSFQRHNSYVHHPNYAIPNTTPQNNVHQSGIPQYPPPRKYEPHRNPPPQPQYGSPQAYAHYAVPHHSIPHYHTAQYNIPQNNVPTSVTYENKPNCPHTYKSEPQLLPEVTWFNRVSKKPFNLEKVLEYLPVENTNPSRPVAHLPYPISYQQNYNTTYANPTNERAWTLLNLYQNPHQNQHEYSAAYIGHIPNAVIVDPISEKKDNTVEKPEVKIHEEELKLPDWQTAPLSKSVLDEVKANIASKSKLFPLSLRKRIKLEKVGKVIKLDELTRSKREANNEEETEDVTEVFEIYEVYLEKSTCNSDTEPGFFRMGNDTDVYPACCPQRISQPQITETQQRK